MPLTRRERALLDYFKARLGEPVSRQDLLASVWGSSYRGGPRTVDIHVCRLRAKCGGALTLETLRRSGYVLRAIADSAEFDTKLPRAAE